MRFLIGVLTGGALTWATSMMLGDALPSPGPVFRWLEAQREAPEGIIEWMRVPTQTAPDEAPRASEPAPAPETEPEPLAVEPPPAPAPTADLAPNVPDAPPAESLDEPAVVLAPEPNGWESAWVPFQTQRSALGFAHVLTRQVQHPFEVRREATQRYRVTFAYADQAERERVLAAVRSLTGSGP